MAATAAWIEAPAAMLTGTGAVSPSVSVTVSVVALVGGVHTASPTSACLAASRLTVKVTEPVAAPPLALALTEEEELDAFAGVQAVAWLSASAAVCSADREVFTA